MTGLEVHAQTVLERVEEAEVCHTSSYTSHSKYLERISLLALRL